MDANKLDVLAREERLIYFREWRRKNPDKVRNHNRNYWLKRAERKQKEEEELNHGTDTENVNNTPDSQDRLAD